MREIIKLHCDIDWRAGLTEELKDSIINRFTGEFIESNYGDVIINKVSFEDDIIEDKVDIKDYMKSFSDKVADILEKNGMLTESFMKEFNEMYEEEEKKWN